MSQDVGMIQMSMKICMLFCILIIALMYVIIKIEEFEIG